MIIDGTKMLADNLTVAGGTTDSDTYDRGEFAGRRFNTRIRIAAQATGLKAGATPGSNDSLQATVKVSPDNSTWSVKYAGPEISGADLKAGAMLVDGLPLLLDTDERYLKVSFTAAGAGAAGATVSAYFCEDGTPHMYNRA